MRGDGPTVLNRRGDQWNLTSATIAVVPSRNGLPPSERSPNLPAHGMPSSPRTLPNGPAPVAPPSRSPSPPELALSEKNSGHALRGGVASRRKWRARKDSNLRPPDS